MTRRALAAGSELARPKVAVNEPDNPESFSPPRPMNRFHMILWCPLVAFAFLVSLSPFCPGGTGLPA